MKRNTLKSVIMLLALSIIACKTDTSNKENDNVSNNVDSYLGQQPPGLTAEAFAPGLVTTGGWEYGGGFSPDMKEFYYLRQVEGTDKKQEFVVYKNNGESWDASVVSSRKGQPFVSPDGKTIAACCTERRSEFGQVDSQLYHWTRKDGKWAGKVISKEQYHLRDMNNEKQIAGSYASPGGPMPCRINSDGSVDKIELLKGDESGEAWGITPTGEVVGLSDDPRGPKGGPQAFMWSNGKTKKIDFGDSPYSAAYSINEKGQIAGLVDVLEPEEKTIGFRTK